jgi:acyl CoA:acetate/3-ketoacid CoA transferase beta subunit
MSASTQRHEYCAVALADALLGSGEILVSPIGILPGIAARLAKLTNEPGLLLTDGVATLMWNVPALGADPSAVIAEGYMPYRSVFDVVWAGRRHVIMGAGQIDRFGNQNISAVGDWARPSAQLLGMRGAPGNTLNHATSYFIPNHDRRVFVERVDVVSGVGYDRAAALGSTASRFHSLVRVVSNLGVFDFDGPDHGMRLRSLHPGVSVEDVERSTSFALNHAPDLGPTREPTPEELRLLRELIDPNGLGRKELAA